MYADQMWWEVGLTDVRERTQQLFAHMLDSRPTEAEWAQLRQFVTLLTELRDYGLMQQPQAPAPGPEPALETDQEPPIVEADTLIGTFHQGLVGGKLITESGLEIPVVPRIVMAAELAHGDQVKAIKEDVFADGRAKYYFVKLKSGGGSNPDRYEAVGFVQPNEQGQWVVMTNGLSVLVSGFDLRESGGQNGDVVTVAYMASEISDGRVAGAIMRVHPSEQGPEAVVCQQLRARRAENAERPDREPTIRFVGQPKVVILGGFNWSHYRDGIAELGGSFAYLSGFSHERVIAGTISGADIVVAITAHVSHKNYDKAKGVARDAGVPFYITDKQNWSGLRALFEQEIIPAWNARANDAAD